MAFLDHLLLSSSDQTATVHNQGAASANTGNNTAVGNTSTNVAHVDQDARSGSGLFGSVGDDSTAANQANVTNSSTGTAAIVTGSANAVGNVSDTTIGQSDSGLGFGLGSDQDATVVNQGYARANTGGNTAIGNQSTNIADVDQDARSGGGLFGGVGDDSTAANQATVANISSGDAAIVTGDAQAVGNVSDTTILQSDSGLGFGFGLGLGSDQEATVVNQGFADANTGNNTAVGNQSTNIADVDQDATAGGGLFGGVGGDSTAANQADVLNASSGDATIVTGDAQAVGNVADTLIDQMDLDLFSF